MNSADKREWLRWAAFILPVFLLYIVFFLLPTVDTFYYAFTQWDCVTSTWIGLRNFSTMLSDAYAYSSMYNTLFYTVFITVIQNIMGLALAVLLFDATRRNKALRTIIFMPYVFSNIAIGYAFSYMFDTNAGAVNAMLKTANLQFLIRRWISDPSVSRWLIVFCSVWRAMGYTMVLNIAGMTGISRDYYDSALVDGASKWRQFQRITFPLMAPATTINVMLCLIGNLTIYDQVNAITGGGPNNATESVALYIYRLGFKGGGKLWGYASALSMVWFLMLLIVVVIATSFLRKREVSLF